MTTLGEGWQAPALPHLPPAIPTHKSNTIAFQNTAFSVFVGLLSSQALLLTSPEGALLGQRGRELCRACVPFHGSVDMVGLG